MMQADTDDGSHPQSHLRALRRHVTSALHDATNIIEHEYDEIGDEIRAFEDFHEQVKTFAPSNTNQPAPKSLRCSQEANMMQKVRQTYRNTILAVPHYEEVYGEPLQENITAELGPNIARCVAPESPAHFSDLFKKMLLAGTVSAIKRRRHLQHTLSVDLTSLTQVQNDLVDLLDNLDTVTIPSWYREDFRSRVDHLAQERQETLNQLSVPSKQSYHGFCQYLYSGQPWTYPVLTAIVRLREAVVI